MDHELGRKEGSSRELIRFVKDRQGHDLRYAIDYSKANKELGWQPKVRLKEGLQKTIQWYLNQEDWLKEVTSGEYKNYYKRHYLN
jgi:dTDP-glucose 4,6-dehydratase